MFSRQVCGGDQSYLRPASLQREHERAREAALLVFAGVKKMGGAELGARFADDLQQQLEDAFESFREHNDGKNVFAAARTPATLMTVSFDKL